MINFFLIFYWLLILFFIGGCAVVVYHLWMYRMNSKVSLFTVFLFLTGFAIILIFNFYFASQVDWAQYNFIF